MENRKVVDYKVVDCFYETGADLERFEKEVLNYILKGYSLAGGVTTYREKLFQAMVKYEE